MQIDNSVWQRSFLLKSTLQKRLQFTRKKLTKNRSQIDIKVGVSSFMVTTFADVQFFGVLPQSDNELRKSVLNLKNICITYDVKNWLLLNLKRKNKQKRMVKIFIYEN